ncbi:c-type cytochrome [Henriciella barbarensis]|nr:cytochrome c family protein [Henriciella barbarensis]
MGDLFWNKVFGAILAVVLVVMGLQTLSGMVFSSGDGGHHGEEAHSLNEWAQGRFSYYTEIAETGGAGAVEEEVYDLGALLAAADPTSGERAFKAKCSTCHTIEQGGSNGTGPNLHAIIGDSHAHDPSFGYSSAMQATSSESWTYESMDQWLENPSSYIRGTSMAFAGLRRDDERADVIAYLAQYTPDAPAFPEPLPEEEEGAEGDATDGDAVDATLDAETVEDAPTLATGEIETQDVVNDQDSEAEGNVSEVEMTPEAEDQAENESEE